MRATVLAAGLTLALDATAGTDATANTGMSTAHDEINLMASGSGSLTWDGFCFEWVISKGESELQRTQISAFLAITI